MKSHSLFVCLLGLSISFAHAQDEPGDFGPPDGFPPEGFGPPPGDGEFGPPDGFPPEGFGPPPGDGGPGGPMGQSRELIPQFDLNGSGKLETDERAKAREWVKENPTPGPGPRGFRGGGRRGRGGPPRGGEENAPAASPGPQVSVDEATSYPDAELYDPSVLRTLFFTFPSDDWEAELSDFYRTDVDVPASLTVDGKEYPNVGMSFRGNSSYFTVSPGSKRSFNVSIDYEDEDQRLNGFRTLNLLNGHSDPSFVREALFSHIVNHYIPMPRVNFMKVVVNGESWGVYINVQQFNKDFLKEAYGTGDGVRWKVPAGGRNGGGLRYTSDDIEDYRNSYELKSNVDEEAAYQRLIQLCKVLNETPDEELIAKLEPLLNIEDTLWFLALDSVLLDGDGYLSRGSDFFLYESPNGQFHPIFHDSNETFRPAGGGGPGFGGPREPGADGFSVSPLDDYDNEGKPLTRRLLALPELRARYLAYVRTITDEWLSWDKIEPVALGFRETIGDAMEDDTKKLQSTEAYLTSLEKEYGSGRRATPSLKEFVEKRRTALTDNEEVQHPHPVIESVEASWESGTPSPKAGEPILVHVKMQEAPVAGTLLLHWKVATDPIFKVQPLSPASEANSYSSEIEGQSAGARVLYYVEARSEDGLASAFYPPHSGRGADEIEVAIDPAAGGTIAINEVMTSNEATLADPQGDYDDWIELYNRSDEVVDLSGYTLSDKSERLQKWSFPQKSTIAPKGYLLVWADEDGKADSGLHANFKLSKEGETLYLSNAEGEVIDQVDVPTLTTNQTFARITDGDSGWKVTSPTPTAANTAE